MILEALHLSITKNVYRKGRFNLETWGFHMLHLNARKEQKSKKREGLPFTEVAPSWALRAETPLFFLSTLNTLI